MPAFEMTGTAESFPDIFRAVDAAGFPVASRDHIIAIRAGVEDPVEDDAIAWVGSDSRGRRALVVELSDPPVENPCRIPNKPDQPGDSRTWSEQILVSLPLPDTITLSRQNAVNLLRSEPGGFENLWLFEILDIGRTGEIRVRVMQPVRDTSRQRAIRAILEGIPFEFC